MNQSKNEVMAFTSKYSRLSRKLSNKAIILYGDKKFVSTALWDTGATGTCISKEVVEALSLIPTGNEDIQTPSGKDTFNTYLIDIILPNKVIIKDVKVCDSKIGEQNIDILIGMDIINLGDFAVSNYKGITTFSFRTPSIIETDYVLKIRALNIIGPMHGRRNKKRKKK